MEDTTQLASFFLYTRPSLRQPTAPVTCKVAFGTGLSKGCITPGLRTVQDEL